MGLTSRALQRPASPASTKRLQKRQLENSVSWTGRERLRLAWYRLRLEAQDINYASRRQVELQMRLPEDWGGASGES